LREKTRTKTKTNGSARPAWRERIDTALAVTTTSALANRLGTTTQAISSWLSSEREPTPKMRARIVTVIPELPPERPEPPPIPRSRTESASLSREGMTGRERFAAIIERIEDEIRVCGPTVPRNHVAGLYGQLQSAVERLAKFDGDGELSVAALLRSRAWGEVEAVVLEVLRRHPGAAEDLVAALDALRGG